METLHYVGVASILLRNDTIAINHEAREKPYVHVWFGNNAKARVLGLRGIDCVLECEPVALGLIGYEDRMDAWCILWGSRYVDDDTGCDRVEVDEACSFGCDLVDRELFTYRFCDRGRVGVFAVLPVRTVFPGRARSTGRTAKFVSMFGDESISEFIVVDLR